MARPERVLTQRALNRAVLARQLLLQRGRLSLPMALERVGALQAQYAPSGYVGLWSRLEGFDRAALTRALERRQVVQATLMRNTIHLASPRDYWPLVLAIRGERMAWSRRVQKTDPRTMERAAARLREFLADGPRRQAEIVAAFGEEVWRPGIAIWVDLVRVPPSRTWDRRRADLFALAEDWLGPPPELSEQEAIDHLVRRYLGAFGPAPKEDIADWAGMRLGAIAPTARPIASSPFPRRAGSRAARPAARAAVRSGRACRGPVSADLGRDAAGPRPPERDPPRAASAADLPHQDPEFVPDLPRRRRRRGDLALLGRTRAGHAVRTTAGRRSEGAERRCRASSGDACVIAAGGTAPAPHTRALARSGAT